MKSRTFQVGKALAAAALLAALAAPSAFADSGPGHGHSDEDARDTVSQAMAPAKVSDVGLWLSSGAPDVTVSGPGIAGTQKAEHCDPKTIAWWPALEHSQWISPAKDCSVAFPAGDYLYTTTFKLPADLSTLSNLHLLGSIKVDDSVVVQLNGHQIYAGGTATVPADYSATDSSWFKPGDNTLTFTVHNGAGPSGLDFTAAVVSGNVAPTEMIAALASGPTAMTVSGPGLNGAVPALVCIPVNPPWTAPISGTAWIGPKTACNQDDATGDYMYSTTFTLDRRPDEITDLLLTGVIKSDDSVTVFLNGNQIYAGGGFADAAATFRTSDRLLFREGENNLAFVVHNAAGPSGLDFAAWVTDLSQKQVHEVAARPAKAKDEGEQDDGENHGQCVSEVAHSVAPGPGHGEAVRDAAHNCDG